MLTISLLSSDWDLRLVTHTVAWLNLSKVLFKWEVNVGICMKTDCQIRSEVSLEDICWLKHLQYIVQHVVGDVWCFGKYFIHIQPTVEIMHQQLTACSLCWGADQRIILTPLKIRLNLLVFYKVTRGRKIIEDLSTITLYTLTFPVFFWWSQVSRSSFNTRLDLITICWQSSLRHTWKSM